MRKLFIFLLLLLFVGCSQQNIDVEFESNDALIVEARMEDSTNYEILKEIHDEEVVQSVIDIFNSEKWTTNVEIDMEDEPDFRLNGYHLWVSPMGDHLTILKNGTGYVRLSKEYSNKLYVILTGKELGT